jgi:hypothetical protein
MTGRKGKNKIKFFGDVDTMVIKESEEEEEYEVELVPGEWFNPFNGYVYEDKEDFLNELGEMLDKYHRGFDCWPKDWVKDEAIHLENPYFQWEEDHITEASNDYKRFYTTTEYTFKMCDGTYWGFTETEGSDWVWTGIDHHGRKKKKRKGVYQYD